MDLWVILPTGLTVGGMSCMAVQGGLLAALSAQGTRPTFPTILFLVSRFLAYTVLGFGLGLFGSTLAISDATRIIIQFLAGGYMVLIALNMLGVIKRVGLLNIQPPQIFSELVRKQIRDRGVLAPILLGIITVFMPCGTTLAMETLAISTGSPVMGALIMGTFILGTTPLFFGLGYITSAAKRFLNGALFKLAAVIILYLGASSINGGLNLLGYPIDIRFDIDRQPIMQARAVNGVQEASIIVYPTGYSPNILQVQSGIPVQLNLISQGGYGCTSEFRIPSLGISKSVPYNGTATVAFTPQALGNITWTCSMGMYTGTIEVI